MKLAPIGRRRFDYAEEPRMTFHRMHALALAAMLLGAPAAAHAVELKVMAPNIKPEAGRVVVRVYNDAAKWKTGAGPVASVVAQVQDGVATAVFQLPAGRYAASAFQDRNGDGKLGVLPFDWPTEPSGYSGVSRPMFGRPPWDKSDFPLSEDERTTVFVRLN
jgi:uncharacterized protein (DUF2141 family)